MYLRTANNFFKLLSLDRQVNEQTRRVVIFLYLRRAFLWIPYTLDYRPVKDELVVTITREMYSIFHLPMCDAHIAEMKIFLRYSKRQFRKAVLPPHRSATLTITHVVVIRFSLQPPLLIPVIVRETSANASLYRARCYKLWRNGRARNDNRKLGAAGRITASWCNWPRLGKNATREWIVTMSDGLSGRDGLFVRTAYGLLCNSIKFYRDFRRYGIISVSRVTLEIAYTRIRAAASPISPVLSIINEWSSSVETAWYY